MSRLEKLSIADLKAILDFTREQIAQQKEQSTFIENSGTIDGLEKFESKVHGHLFKKVMNLKNNDPV